MKIMKILFHEKNRMHWLLFVIALLFAVIAYPRLPETIPTHFDISGEVNGTGDRSSIFLFPGLILGMLLLAELLKYIDPKRKSYMEFQRPYYLMYFMVCLLFLILEVLIISNTLGLMNFNITSLTFTLLGLLFLIMGNFLPKFKHNYFIGIRTGWTLANADVWYRTHRFSSKIWILGGILLLPAFLFSTKIQILLFVLSTCMITLIPIVYSYFIYRQIAGKEDESNVDD